MRCPMCNKEVSGREWLAGVNKCFSCFDLVGRLRRSGLKVSCLSLVYGKKWGE